MTLKHSFGAVVDPRTRVLILGSLPGERSLAAAQYYAHPANRFWELVGAATDRDLRSLGYQDRLAALLAAGIGLWDVVGSGRRQGSLDAALREVCANDLPGLLAKLPELRALGFNRGSAARIGRRALGMTPLALVDLPSSSPAYAAMPYAAKRARWFALREHLKII